jgi:serine/threonine-protein kinase HipA
MKNYKFKNPKYTELDSNLAAEKDFYFPKSQKCLYCYQPLQAHETHYHVKCLRKFFGLDYVPSLDYTPNNLPQLATQYLKQHVGVPGVQPKVSLSWHKKQDHNPVKKLTIVGLYGHFILKPQTSLYQNLPELESLTMKMAQTCGLKTVPFTLFPLKDGSLAYLTKRVDRHKQELYHMEDMCQLTERLTEDKYKGSHEQVGKTLQKVVEMPLLDLGNYYEYVLFCFLTGNADMHLKNWSVLETRPGYYGLAPAYDLLATKLVLPQDTEELALTLNGKKSKLKRKDFEAAYTTNGLSKKLLDSTLENFYYCRYELEELVNQSFVPDTMKEAFHTLLHQRMKQLEMF